MTSGLSDLAWQAIAVAMLAATAVLFAWLVWSLRSRPVRKDDPTSPRHRNWRHACVAAVGLLLAVAGTMRAMPQRWWVPHMPNSLLIAIAGPYISEATNSAVMDELVDRATQGSGFMVWMDDRGMSPAELARLYVFFREVRGADVLSDSARGDSLYMHYVMTRVSERSQTQETEEAQSLQTVQDPVYSVYGNLKGKPQELLAVLQETLDEAPDVTQALLTEYGLPPLEEYRSNRASAARSILVLRDGEAATDFAAIALCAPGLEPALLVFQEFVGGWSLIAVDRASRHSVEDPELRLHVRGDGLLLERRDALEELDSSYGWANGVSLRLENVVGRVAGVRLPGVGSVEIGGHRVSQSCELVVPSSEASPITAAYTLVRSLTRGECLPGDTATIEYRCILTCNAAPGEYYMRVKEFQWLGELPPGAPTLDGKHLPPLLNWFYWTASEADLKRFYGN